MEYVDFEKVWIALVVFEYDDEGTNVIEWSEFICLFQYQKA